MIALDLLRCPFCDIELEQTGELVKFMRHPVRSIAEARCPASGVSFEISPERDDDKIALWNRRSVTSQASEGEGDSGTIHDDESTAAAMERAQRLRERGWKLEAAAERLEQEAHDRAIKRGEHTGTDGI